MGTMLDYLDWRGDLSFSESPFNEVDNLVLAQMSYVELDGIVPGIESGGCITVQSAATEYFHHHTIEEMTESKSFIRYAPLVLKKMGETRRYADVLLTNYVNQIDLKNQKQFAALHVLLPDRTTYIAFRGTDDTLVGWQEDFSMSYRTVPSQEEAVRYVNLTAKGLLTKYRMGGHSKGGNLAVYAGVYCNKRIKNKIVKIYNNDGPGFIEDILKNSEYEETLKKVQTFVPETSVIGMLLEHAGDQTVVGSTERGLMQHDAMSWEILGNHFQYKESISKESEVIDEIITGWLSELDAETKEEFIQNLFHMLEMAGIKNLSDMIAGGVKTLYTMLKISKEMTDNTREAINKLIRLIASRVIM